MTPSKKPLVWIAYYVFLLLCLLVGAELILRKFVYNISYPTMTEGSKTYPIDTTEFHTTATINQLKMRDKEYGEKTKGEYRILTLGDSFTFGLGVHEPETFSRLLEGKLRDQSQKNIVVMNGGGRAWAKDAYDFLMENGRRLAPDRIVYAIYLENDFYDGLPYVLSRKQVSQTAIAEKQKTLQHDPLHSTKDFFRNRIYLFDFLWSQVVRIGFVNDYLVKFNFRAGARNLLLRNLPPLEQELVATELDFLEKIRQESDRLKAPLLIVLVPFKLQLFHKELFQNDRYDYRKPNEIIRNFCEGRKIPYLDLLDSYEKLDPGTVKGFYYSRDLHWTKAGHQQAAEQLLPLLVPPRP